MLDAVLDWFAIKPDYDLNIMTAGQTLFQVTARLIEKMQTILENEHPDILLVQGDTTTTFIAALAAYYGHIRVGHLEAGLRTGNKYAPFPEEMNRKMTSALADFHYAPTEHSKQNLLREGYPEDSIFVTGNTVIDALFYAVEKVRGTPCPLPELAAADKSYKRWILITGHRRENFGEKFANLCEGYRSLAEEFPDTAFVYPVHLNPNVQKPVYEILSEVENFFLLAPVVYPAFVWLMNRAYLIITDSGGVQEEAPSLGKPVLVTREITERPEAVKAGTVKLVGTHKADLIKEVERLIADPTYYREFSREINPYGDGKASQRIVAHLLSLPAAEK